MKAEKLLKTSSNYRRMDNIFGYIFVAPMLIGVLVVSLIPIVATFILSFTEWNFVTGFSEFNFVGGEYFQALIKDATFIKSLKNNFIFIITIPITMGLALLIASLINSHVYMKGLFKVIYFMPYISSVVAVAFVWQIIFHPSQGPLNQMLMSLGMDNPPKWIADIKFALPSVMMIYIWMSIGFNMIIYLAGLQSIPQDLYEAADIDGAQSWHKFFKITLPLLSPTSFFLLVTGIINSFKVFDIIKVLTNGGPANSTTVLVFYQYRVGFEYLKFSYASAISIVLLLCVFTITVLQWYGQRKWVNY